MSKARQLMNNIVLTILTMGKLLIEKKEKSWIIL